MFDHEHAVARESARGARAGMRWRIALIVSLIGGVAAVMWFSLASEQTKSSQTNSATSGAVNLGLTTEKNKTQQWLYSGASPSWNGSTGSNIVSAPKALLQTPALHRVVEDLIGDVLGNGSVSNDPHGFRARLAARAKAHFPPELADSAIAFLNRYVNYLESLDALNLSSAKNDAAALRSLYEARSALRKSFFAPEEYEALFARDDRLDRYTIARMEIEANAKLDSREREQALAAAASELTPDERAERASWQSHLSAQTQTAFFEAKQTGDEERFAARKAEHGEAAAQRLAELDRSEREWQSRLAQYEQAARDAGNGAISKEQLSATRDQLFTAQEQLRLEAALALRQKKS
jgi:lipase chaperone LimK